MAQTFEGYGVIDTNQFSKLEELDGASPGFLKSCIDVFKKSAQDSVNDIDAAIKSNDMKLVESKAHGLKGSAANIGAHRFHKSCEAMLEMSRVNGGNPQGCTDLYPHLVSALRETMDVFAKY